jgi:DNA-directed RNA polymerase beta' subunit
VLGIAIGNQPALADPNPKVMSGKKKFNSHGLFSEQIFGPIKNYTCQCGTYHGISRSGGTCKKCGIDIVNSDVRRNRFAKIILPIQIVNPIMYDLICDVSNGANKVLLDRLMKSEKSVLYLQTSKDEKSYYYMGVNIKIFIFRKHL